MKNRIKQLVAIMVFAFATQSAFSQEENGYVKVFEDFKEIYIGAANNQHLFRIDDGADVNVKFYDADMKFIKETKLQFLPVKEQHSTTYTDIETYNDMLLVNRSFTKKEGDMEGYAYDEISRYDLNDLSKPKYTQQIKSLPNFPMMKALKFAKFTNKAWTNVKIQKFVSNDRIAYLYTTSFDAVGGAKKIGYKDIEHDYEYYLVIMDEELTVLYQDFIPLKVDKKGDVYDKVVSLLISGDDLVISVLDNSIYANSEYVPAEFRKTGFPMKESLYHLNIKNKIEMNEIQIGDDLNEKYAISLSSDGLSVAGTYYYVASEKELKRGKYRGQGVFKYNLADKKISKNKLFPYKEPSKIYSVHRRIPPFWFGENLVVKMIPPASKMNLDNLRDSFSLNTLDNNLEIVSRYTLSHSLKVAYSKISATKTAGTINSLMYNYNLKKQQLTVLYTNAAFNEEEELNMEEKDKGSLVFQLEYLDGEFIKTSFQLPKDIQYLNQTTLNGHLFTRAKYFTFPFNTYFDSSLYRYYPSVLYPEWFYNSTNTQSSFISQPNTFTYDVINLIKPNK